MRVSIPSFDTKAELFAYLKEHKSELIAKKKSMPITSDASSLGVSPIKTGENTKANTPVAGNMDVLRVKVVANTANWIDSHSDMLLPGCWDKSINERKNLIPHLHDHVHQLDAKVGEVQDIFGSTLSFSELGIQGLGTTQALIFITDVMKSYNEQVFNQYKAGKINQHSIGLQYTKLDLAINDPESEKEFDFWEKYYPQVINKDVADTQGFFWVVQEIKLLENSAVLFGSNIITPTLDNNVKHTEPGNPTQKNEPHESTQTETEEDHEDLTQQNNFFHNL